MSKGPIWLRRCGDASWPVEVREQIGAPGGDWTMMSHGEYAAYCAVHSQPVKKPEPNMTPSTEVNWDGSKIEKPINWSPWIIAGGVIIAALILKFLK